MVTLEPIPASRDSVYYTGSYYLGGGGQSEFMGRGTEVLGLSGKEVHPEVFKNLWQGLRPDGKKEIVQRQRHQGKDRHTPGTDIVINLDKSVSIAYAAGTGEQRAAIEKAALANARGLVSYWENNCSFSRRGKEGRKLEKAGITAAAFFEFTNRNGEPHCHVHVVVLNVAFRASDRTFGTIRRLPFFQHKMVSGALARADMAARLSEMGLTCRRPVNERGKKAWHFVVQGVPQAAREAMSSRAREVRAKLGEWGRSDSKAAAQAAVVTRGDKVFLPLDKLLPRWGQTLTKLGFGPAQAQAIWRQPKERSVVRDDRNDERAVTGGLRAAEREKERAERAVTRALAVVTRQEATFTARDLLREAAIIAQDGGVLAGILEKAVSERLVRSREVVLLAEVEGETRFTTRAILELERKLIDLAEESKALLGARVSVRIIERAIARTEAKATAQKRQADPGATEVRLTPEQRVAVYRSCQGPGGDGTGTIRVVTGHAGVGKTTAVCAVAEALRLSGRKDKHLVGCALSNVATQNLQAETGLKNCVSVAKLLYELEKNVASDLKHHARQLIRAAQKKKTSKPERIKLGPKSVVILDESACLGVPSMTRLVEAVQKRGATLICLGDHRQLQHPVEPGCAHVVLEKRLGAALITRITRQRSWDDRKNVYDLSEGKGREVVEDLKARGRLHVAPTKEATLRDIIRSWQVHGASRPTEHILIAQTNAERERLNSLAQAARRESGHLRPRSIRLGPERRQFYENDAVIFTTPADHDRKTMPGLRHFGIANGTPAFLVRIDRRKDELTFKLEDRVVTVPVKRCGPALDLGYCLTAHRVQSKTYESARIAVGGSMTHKELAYVIASRARGETHLFCEGGSVPFLAEQLSRSRAKAMAHDYLPQQDLHHAQAEGAKH